MKRTLNKFERLYEDKFQALEEAFGILEVDGKISNKKFKKLTEEFDSLLRQTVKLVKRSDKIQKKLRDTREDLREKNEKITSDLEKAAEYVFSLLPEEIDKDYIKTSWKFVPSSQLGGDAFGYNKIDENHISLYLLDVTGHGIGSALHSVTALNALKYQNLAEIDYKKPEQVLKGLNNSFQMPDHGEKFFTLWYGVYNKNNKSLRYSSAGHPPAMLETNGEIKMLENDNFVIGGLPEFNFVSSEIEIADPSNLFIYSDGVYEVQVDENKIWDIENLKDYYLNNVKENAFDLTELFEYVKKINISDTLDDDFSALFVHFK